MEFGEQLVACRGVYLAEHYCDPAYLFAPQVEAAYIHSISAQQRAETAENPGNVAIGAEKHMALGNRFQVEAVYSYDAGVFLAEERPCHTALLTIGLHHYFDHARKID